MWYWLRDRHIDNGRDRELTGRPSIYRGLTYDKFDNPVDDGGWGGG